MSEPQIRDALRQLGQAVGALVRAVLGAVRRRRPAAAVREPTDGPPQAWLDFVAETDPEWLARSPWADRVVTPEPVREGRRHRRATPADSGAERAATTAPAVQTWSDERRTWEPQAEHTATPDVRRARPSAEAATEVSPRPLTADTHAPHLLPVAEPGRPTDVGPADAPGRRPARLARPVDGEGPEEGDRDPAGHRPYPAADLRRTLSYAPDVPPVPHAAPRRLVGSPRATVTELPGTWVPRAMPRHEPAAPTVASQPVWPELPATPGLDDTDPGPGLAAVLWELDGRPDSLTTAQRRS